MDKLKKYKKQIVTFITISLLLTYGIYPCLTMANTFANIVGAIALGILILWGILEVKDVYDRESEEERIFNEQWKKHIEKQMGEMDKIHKQNDSLKKKSIVKIDFTGAKGMNEIDGVIKPIAEGRVKISVETPKTKHKPKTK
jgi:hypothetical protein